MDVVRVVHLDMANHPEGTARTDIGHSVGRFEGAELVMETALFSAGVLLETAQFSDGEETAMSPYTGTNTTGHAPADLRAERRPRDEDR